MKSGQSRSRFHLSVLTGWALACSNGYRAALPILKRKRMDYDSFTVLKFLTLGQPWRCACSSRVARYIHTNSRQWPLLLRSLFMNVIISSCKVRVTCLIPSSICVETEITGNQVNFIIPNWYFTVQTFTQICLRWWHSVFQCSFLNQEESDSPDFDADETLMGLSVAGYSE